MTGEGGASGVPQPQPQAHHQPRASQDDGHVTERREPVRNFVFINEQNRHKRLKVVKACDACRKKKIKCDAANTNSWPCSACKRVKVACVPPALGLDQMDSFGEEDSDSFGYQSSMSGSMSTFDRPPSAYSESIYQQAMPGYGNLNTLERYPSNEYPNMAGAPNNTALTPVRSWDPWMPQQNQLPFSPSGQLPPPGQQPARPMSNMRQGSMVSNACLSDVSESVLANQMGDLQISGVGHAPYLVHNRTLAEQPAVQEEEMVLPMSKGFGAQVRIPEEMMPSDARAKNYFRYFFDNVHPYVPVLYPRYLYDQWDEDPNSISPLILDSIFAISSYLLDEHEESRRWLALAKRHEEAFKDTPRLTTLQGNMLLLKARETVPTRGYYYRAWQNIVLMLTMAKDLGLHEHYEDHQDGSGCAAAPVECLVKSRVWSTLYLVELMVGGPQGRVDFVATTDTIDFRNQYPQLDRGDPEYKISEQFSHFLACIRMVRDSIRIFHSMRKRRKDWACDPSYIDHDSRYGRWLSELPQHLRIIYPSDESPPRIPFHFTASLHAYYNLCLIMHHRPQLQAYEDAMSDEWRDVMITCYEAAKRLCRLQEAVYEKYGLNGFLCMQRGINFTIYAILTSVMLHLVAVTHPHPAVHHGAAGYFSRHMRVLERCEGSWPMPQVEQQILSLRTAFSADITKPFELKSDFPGTPSRSDHSVSPVATTAAVRTPPIESDTPSNQGGYFHSSQPQMRPTSYMSNEDYPTPDSSSLAMMNAEQNQYQAEQQRQQQYAAHFSNWNPGPIFENFAGLLHARPPPEDSSPGAQSIVSPTTSNVPITHTNAYFGNLPQGAPQQALQYDPQTYATYNQAQAPTPLNAAMYAQMTTPAPTLPPSTPVSAGTPADYGSTTADFTPARSRQPSYPTPLHRPALAPPTPQYVTPSMWQDALATAYGTGSKRRWPGHGASGGGEEGVKRSR